MPYVNSLSRKTRHSTRLAERQATVATPSDTANLRTAVSCSTSSDRPTSKPNQSVTAKSFIRKRTKRSETHLEHSTLTRLRRRSCAKKPLEKDEGREVTPSPLIRNKRGLRSLLEQEGHACSPATSVIKLDSLCSHPQSSFAYFSRVNSGCAFPGRRGGYGTVIHPEGYIAFSISYGDDYNKHLIRLENELRRDEGGWTGNRGSHHEKKLKTRAVGKASIGRKKAENFSKSGPGSLLKKQQYVTFGMRKVLIQGLLELFYACNLHIKTIYVAVELFNRLLEVMIVQKTELQYVGCACLFIACKLEEIHVPSLNGFILAYEDTLEKTRVVRTECKICTALSFRLQTVTPYNFMFRFMQASNVSCGLPSLTNNPFFEIMVEYLMELSLLQDEYEGKKPSLIMASIIYLSRATLGLVDSKGRLWSPTLEFYTGYKRAQLADTVLKLHSIQSRPAEFQSTRVYEKYKQEEFLEIALKPFVLIADLHL